MYVVRRCKAHPQNAVSRRPSGGSGMSRSSGLIETHGVPKPSKPPQTFLNPRKTPPNQPNTAPQHPANTLKPAHTGPATPQTNPHHDTTPPNQPRHTLQRLTTPPNLSNIAPYTRAQRSVNVHVCQRFLIGVFQKLSRQNMNHLQGSLLLGL